MSGSRQSRGAAVGSLVWCVLVCAVCFADLPGAEGYLAARAAERQGKWAEALEAYDAVHALAGPLAPFALVRAGRCRSVSADAEGAERAFQQVIRDCEPGPWTRMAQFELAMHHARQEDHAACGRLLLDGLDVVPAPWWFSPYQRQAVESLVAEESSRADGFALLGEYLDTRSRVMPRSDAARMLAGSEEVDDKFHAAEVLLGVGAYGEARKLLALLYPTAVLGEGRMPRWQYLEGVGLLGEGRRAKGRALLEEVRGTAGEDIWALRARVALAKDVARAGQWQDAEEAFAGLLEDDADAEETGEAVWWYAAALEANDQPSKAAAQFVRLAECCSGHVRADDALLRAGKLLVACGDEGRAVSVLSRCSSLFPRSSLVPEAHWLVGRLCEDEGKPDEAGAAYSQAAKGEVGDFYVHRSLACLARLGGKEVPRVGHSLCVAGPDAFLLAFLPEEGVLEDVPASWAEEPWYERLLFLGEHGFEEAEWEALHLLVASQENGLSEGLCRVVADAGPALTAMQFAQGAAWAQQDGRQTVARLRVRYPRPYWSHVTGLAEETGLDPLLILAVARQESTFRPRIASSAGACGVMQLMPATARWLAGVEPGVKRSDAQDLERPASSIRLGAYYLRRMVGRYDGNVVLALAAYNAGPGNVDKWLARNDIGEPEEFIDRIPFGETKAYVRRVLGAYAAYHSVPAGRER